MNQKEAVRESVTSLLQEVNFGTSTVCVRVNAVDSPFFHDDMRALLDAPTLPDAVVVPKVDGFEHLHAAHTHLEAAGERASEVRLVAMVETPMGLLNLSNTLSASDRLD